MENVEICENDNSSKATEEANENKTPSINVNNDSNPENMDIDEPSNETNEILTALPEPVSPIQTPEQSPVKIILPSESDPTSNENEFQTVKSRKKETRKKEAAKPKIDIKRDIEIFLCESDLLPTKRKMKQALASLDKHFGCKVTSPIYQVRPDCFMTIIKTMKTDHLGFKVRVKSERAEEVLEYINNGGLNSWNVIEVKQEETKYRSKPRNSCHTKCDHKHL